MAKQIERGGEKNEQINAVIEQLQRIEGFKTDHGSVYNYDNEGHMFGVSQSTESSLGKGERVRRSEKEKQDITVFTDLNPQELAIVKGTFDPNRKTEHPRIVEVQSDNTGKVIQDISEVSDPEKLVFGVLEDGGKWKLFKKATLIPTKGFNLFDWKKLPDGSHARSIGGKVTEIEYKK